MAKKTFISYKYSEARHIRDKIVSNMGNDASYYNGETSDSPDLTDTSTENIKRNLRDMMYNTSVTIVVISPNMKKSKWIDWEIEYSLKEITREDRTSRSNGIVGVIMKVNGSYNWIVSRNEYKDGCKPRIINDDYLYPIIKNNRFNQLPPEFTCDSCKTVDQLTGSYISLINEDSFMSDVNKYIDSAFDKSKSISKYKISKLK